jgi:hypothetical protein
VDSRPTNETDKRVRNHGTKRNDNYRHIYSCYARVFNKFIVMLSNVIRLY